MYLSISCHPFCSAVLRFLSITSSLIEFDRLQSPVRALYRLCALHLCALMLSMISSNSFLSSDGTEKSLALSVLSSSFEKMCCIVLRDFPFSAFLELLLLLLLLLELLLDVIDGSSDSLFIRLSSPEVMKSIDSLSNALSGCRYAIFKFNRRKKNVHPTSN